jgi:3-hydroxyacyl-CoA dehydrogenase
MASEWDAAAYLKQAEAAAAHAGGIDANTPRRPIDRFGVIGVGTMGSGVFTNAGLPMSWADSVGLKRVHDAVVALHAQHDDNWAPATLLAELARAGRSFADHDKAKGVA